ncbi:hypothetical protein AGMMS49992_25120 [Clostridia bacterium]|nr:hypothetical protein AGMMS49992_25120 [Clostridia bacterium]
MTTEELTLSLLTKIVDRLDGLEAGQAKLVDRLDKLEAGQAKLEAEMRSEFKQVNNRLDHIESDIGALKVGQNELEASHKKLSAEMQHYLIDVYWPIIERHDESIKKLEKAS